MKKSMIAVLAALASVATFAASPDDVVLAFSTPGPDTYKDGTTVVRDGEYYAVVWTAANAAFAGIDANGKAIGEDSKVVLKAQLAKDGKCPSVVFRLPADYEVDGVTVGALAASGGTWSVYLLDTRRFVTDENDVITAEVESVGGSNAIVGYGLAGSAENMGSAAAGSAVATTDQSAAPEEAKNLRIKDIKFVGDNVHITVLGSLSSLAYELKAGDEPDALESPADGKAQYGKDGGELLIVTPKVPGAQFFQVNRK